MAAPHIGIDLDNTIIDYEHVFAPVAEEMGLLPAGPPLTSKVAVKDAVRAHGGEEAWMRLQGQVYGRCIGRARPYAGVDRLLVAARDAGARVSIVSHKTRQGHFDAARVDLWQAAQGWLRDRGYTTGQRPLIAPQDVHFRETREAKIAAIASLGCTLFIDDLPEVLLHPDFPEHVEKLWFAHKQPVESGESLKPLRTWAEIMDSVLARL